MQKEPMGTNYPELKMIEPGLNLCHLEEFSVGWLVFFLLDFM